MRDYPSKTAEVILNHRSIRSYKQESIPQEHLDIILEGMQMAPSSVNGQSRSIIEIKNPNKKAEIIKIASNQQWIGPAAHFFILCMDFYRANIAAAKHDQENMMKDQMEAVMVGTMDAGLAMGNGIAIAESLGYGVVPIGAIRSNPKRIIELLELPEYVFPLNGFVLGVKNEESAVKPRFPKSAFYHVDKYDVKKAEAEVELYDQVMSEYMSERTGGKSQRNWSQTIAMAFGSVKHPDITPALKEQGFKLK